MADGISAAERAAMKELAAERRLAEKRAKLADKEAAERQDLVDAIAKMAPEDARLATRVDELVRAAAPELASRTWYGMPAWTLGGKVVCFFQDAGKFKYRYATIGFQEDAALDDGAMWPVSYAVLEIGPAEEARITELVRRAVGASPGA